MLFIFPGSGRESLQCAPTTVRKLARVEITRNSAPADFKTCTCGLKFSSGTSRNAVINVESFKHNKTKSKTVDVLLNSNAEFRVACVSGNQHGNKR